MISKFFPILGKTTLYVSVPLKNAPKIGPPSLPWRAVGEISPIFHLRITANLLLHDESCSHGFLVVLVRLVLLVTIYIWHGGGYVKLFGRFS